ncbi:NAD-dependent epimerase/dehydratase family protein [Clavibacter michiganensis]|uniref:NAD-dependent epimerase/dehydratase family protein n=1 Tax=Clavibacter michiganensis TaxID=28447 RepID=UPI001C66F99E|nr:NAD(P)-dependent oxidoreductase [Clavibacter michiganensis]
MTTAAVPVWVIGARGLLGASLVEALAADPRWAPVAGDPLPWETSEEAVIRAAARAGAERLLRAGRAAGRWAVMWCAGAAVTGSTREQLAHELGQLEAVLDEIAVALDAAPAPGGALFYSSSAGGVYAGAAHPPFTEATEPRPLAPYGEAKLRAEGLVRAFGHRAGVSTLVGRIANLYGPRQAVGKPQGLITQLARANLSPTPASIYVPLETVRDYLYADDCALLVRDATMRLMELPAGAHVVKILASGQPVTISALLGHFTALGKARPNVMLGLSPLAGYQAVDLRLESVVWPDLDERDTMPLPAGIHITAQALIAGMQSGELTPR